MNGIRDWCKLRGQVGATAGVTRHTQEVQLDSKLTLIDSPGVVYPFSRLLDRER